jgi:hypothetical protein
VAEAASPGPRDGETQQQRAQRAIGAIFSGGDLTEEAMTLANEFTDRQTARLKAALRRKS